MIRWVMLTVALVAMLGFTDIRAQAPAGGSPVPVPKSSVLVPYVAPPSPPAVPQNDAFIVGYAQAVAGWQTAVNSACQQLDVTKTYQQVVANATKEIEAHVPGYTMDWSTGKLVPKAQPTK